MWKLGLRPLFPEKEYISEIFLAVCGPHTRSCHVATPSCCSPSHFRCYCWAHRLINFIDTKVKCRHLKKFTCKETLRQVLIRVYYRLDIQTVMLVFSTQLCELLHLQPSLSTFWAQMAPASLVATSRLKKGLISRAQPPPTCPRNESARIKNITYGPYKSLVHK